MELGETGMDVEFCPTDDEILNFQDFITKVDRIFERAFKEKKHYGFDEMGRKTLSVYSWKEFLRRIHKEIAEDLVKMLRNPLFETKTLHEEINNMEISISDYIQNLKGQERSWFYLLLSIGLYMTKFSDISKMVMNDIETEIVRAFLFGYYFCWMKQCRIEEKSNKDASKLLKEMILGLNLYYKFYLRKNKRDTLKYYLEYIQITLEELIYCLLAVIIQKDITNYGNVVKEHKTFNHELKINYNKEDEIYRKDDIYKNIERFNKTLNQVPDFNNLLELDTFNQILIPINPVIKNRTETIEKTLSMSINKDKCNVHIADELICIDFYHIILEFCCNLFDQEDHLTEMWEQFSKRNIGIPLIAILDTNLKFSDEFSSREIVIIKRKIKLVALLIWLKQDSTEFTNMYLDKNKIEEMGDWKLLKMDLFGECNCWRFCGEFTGLNFLFYEEEIEMMTILESNNHNPLDHLELIAKPLLTSDKHLRKTAFGVKNMDALKKSILSLHREGREISINNLESDLFQFCFVIFYPMLYIADISTDMNAIYMHWIEENIIFFSLSIFFILAPLFSELVSKVCLKLSDKKKLRFGLTWKDVLIPEDIQIFPRSLQSINYAWKSRMKHGKEINAIYSKLFYLRLKKREYWIKREDWMDSPKLIGAMCFSRMLENEKFLNHSKVGECLNESAPQLLLQMTYIVMHLLHNEKIGLWSIVGIFTSLISLSFGMHSAHYYMHYGGYSYKPSQNDFTFMTRLLDFLIIIFIYSSRFMALSFLAALHPIWFIISSSLYLAILFIYLYFICSFKKRYKKMFARKTLVLWPFQRLFTIPYVLKVWKYDTPDHVLFHLETLAMSIGLIFLIPPDHSIWWLRFVIPCVVISVNVVLLPMLLVLYKKLHPLNAGCELIGRQIEFFFMDGLNF